MISLVLKYLMLNCFLDHPKGIYACTVFSFSQQALELLININAHHKEENMINK